ncbi:MAG: DUF1559 domain-containing protein, partial [Planctomycetales bacterium]|nr:DUF1559 domain-containing protein [Planctomycetales bacterium]
RQWIGVLPYLFPYVEQAAIYQLYPLARELDPLRLRSTLSAGNASRMEPWWQDDDEDPSDMDTLWDAAQFRLSFLLCPADEAYANTKTNVSRLHTYGAVGAPSGTINARTFPVDATPALGRTNYLGVAGGMGKTGSAWEVWRGCFTNRSRTTLGEISDGTSNVMLFGEVTGSWSDASTPAGRTMSFTWNNGPLPTAWRLGGDNPHVYYKFNSLHGGKMVNFALADGSVRAVAPTVDRSLFLYLSSMADGRAAAWDN